jgi:rod shape determining protein RodA
MVMLQPDFGTAALLIMIWFGMIAVAGLTRKQFFVLLLISLVVATSGWFLFLKPYQKDRIFVFLNPGSDPLGRGYTVLQSVTAFGSGGVWGRGLGYGPQSRLNFLPENRTDFIFARIGEELGLVGVLGVLALYGIILWRMLFAAAKTSDTFGRTIAVGAFVALLSGVAVNAGMNIGLLPVTGVPLPFISYGGSSLLTMFILVGLVESVIIHGETWEVDDTSDVTTFSLGG